MVEDGVDKISVSVDIASVEGVEDLRKSIHNVIKNIGILVFIIFISYDLY